ncbi:YqgQ family protein [Bacillus niameyensis]|uniref:YqgQ family protein n=1 Tax=Bacillus niameyensis TaxID=1522308 RepID=UPI000781027A|nr:YqgQ family protein [Bacillus niameyensis]
MKFVYDVQQMLKRFGIFTYMGERLLDIELMEMEVKELFFSNLISKEEMQRALTILKKEMENENKKRKGDKNE